MWVSTNTEYNKQRQKNFYQSTFIAASVNKTEMTVNSKFNLRDGLCCSTGILHRVSEKKTPTHIIGYKLRSSYLILIIFDINIPHKIWHHMTS